MPNKSHAHCNWDDKNDTVPSSIIDIDCNVDKLSQVESQIAFGKLVLLVEQPSVPGVPEQVLLEYFPI